MLPPCLSVPHSGYRDRYPGLTWKTVLAPNTYTHLLNELDTRQLRWQCGFNIHICRVYMYTQLARSGGQVRSPGWWEAGRISAKKTHPLALSAVWASWDAHPPFPTRGWTPG